MAHGNVSVRAFIKDIDNGDYVIPHFQRDFDWQPNMVSDLFQSILYDYYAGTILLWALQDEERKIEMWDPLWGTESSAKPSKAILDGQQRLSSIYYALCAPNKQFPNRTTYFYFFINLDNVFSGNEEESITNSFYKSYKKIESFKAEKKELIEEGLFPLCLLSDESFISSKEYAEWIEQYVASRIGKEEFKHLTAFNVARKIERILNYQFLTETLEKKEIREICTIFANINSKGLKLDVFDLMNAFLYPKGIQLRKSWDAVDNQALKDVDSEMKVYLLKLISLFKQKYCSSKFLYNLIPGSTIQDKKGNKTVLIKDGPDEFNAYWTESLKWAEKARDRIMNSGLKDFGAIKSKFIPNTTIIPVMGALLLHYNTSLKQKVSEDEFWNKISKWYWCAVLSGDYSGSSDSVMSKDYRDMLEWFDDSSKMPERITKITASFINESLNLQRVKNVSSSQYRAVLNLLARKSAQDFFTGRLLGNYKLDEIDDHHIFPVKSGLKMPEEKVDCILNRTLLCTETNKKIQNQTPKEYYADIVEKIGDESKVKGIMQSHFISEVAITRLKENDFEGFIAEREMTIKKEIKNLIGIKE